MSEVLPAPPGDYSAGWTPAGGCGKGEWRSAQGFGYDASVRWGWAVLAPVLVGVMFLGTGQISLAILAYHALCAVVIVRNRVHLRGSFRWSRSIARWSAGTALLVAASLCCAPLVLDPA